VFVQTSRHEGFCLPPLEAMAAGCPVVCTDAGGTATSARRRELPHPEPTTEAWAAALRRVLTDAPLRERLVAAGRRTAAEYAWDRRIDALEQVLRAGGRHYSPRACRLTSLR